jgi:hypothetical protein
MKISGWNEFELLIPVRASVDMIYQAWATSKGIESWFLRSAEFADRSGKVRAPGEFVQKGDVYQWLWHGYDDTVTEHNPVLEANGKDFFQFEFTGKCVVSVSVKRGIACSLVTLKQERIPDDGNPKTNLFVGCQLGWTFYLTNLKSIMEGGLDLRNQDVNLPGVVNA